MDAINARQVTITNVASDQCALWLCRRIPLRRGDYCSKSCLDVAISYSKSTYPFRIANVFSSTTEFAPVATEILNLLKANKESGVPRPSQDVFTIPPWQSSIVFCQSIYFPSCYIIVITMNFWVSLQLCSLLSLTTQGRITVSGCSLGRFRFPKRRISSG